MMTMAAIYEADQSAQTKAAKVTHLLHLHGSLTLDEIMEATGMRSREGVRYLMTNVELGVPVFQDEPSRWVLMDFKRKGDHGLE